MRDFFDFLNMECPNCLCITDNELYKSYGVFHYDHSKGIYNVPFTGYELGELVKKLEEKFGIKVLYFKSQIFIKAKDNLNE